MTSQEEVFGADIDWDWEKLSKEVFEDDKRPIILYDGVCALCNSGVNFAMDLDVNATFRFCSIQSKVAQSLLMKAGRDPKEANVVLIEEDNVYISSDAVSRICLKLDGSPIRAFGRLGRVTPPFIRESIYNFVSANRFAFGDNDECRMDYDNTFASRFVSDPID